MNPSNVFCNGNYSTDLIKVECSTDCNTHHSPPKQLLISCPSAPASYSVLLFLHGYLLYNSFYSQLLRHVASHGFIVVAPQTPTKCRALTNFKVLGLLRSRGAAKEESCVMAFVSPSEYKGCRLSTIQRKLRLSIKVIIEKCELWMEEKIHDLIESITKIRGRCRNIQCKKNKRETIE